MIKKVTKNSYNYWSKVIYWEIIETWVFCTVCSAQIKIVLLGKFHAEWYTVCSAPIKTALLGRPSNLNTTLRDYAANMCNPDVYQRDLNDLAAQFTKVGSVCLRGKLLIKKLKINKFMQKVGKKLQGCMHDNFIKVYIKNM